MLSDSHFTHLDMKSSGRYKIDGGWVRNRETNSDHYFPNVMMAMMGRWQHIADIDSPQCIACSAHYILYIPSPSQPPIPILILIRDREGGQLLRFFCH